MPINIRAYEELLYMHYQITTDNYEPNESPLALENLILTFSSILQLYICIRIKLIVIFEFQICRCLYQIIRWQRN